MPLITSISGIRGTIGGKPGDNLTPIDVVSFSSAYGTWLKGQKNDSDKSQLTVAVGRDARPSGKSIYDLVVSTLVSMGIDVLDLDLSTTPTVEMIVIMDACDGGIVITASHNPVEWNALKLLNSNGEFLSAKDGEKILEYASLQDYQFSEINQIGKIIPSNNAIERHVEAILSLPDVDPKAIRNADFKIAVDAVNSTGGIAVPILLSALGVKRQELLFCEPNGQFPHNPEPLRKHLDDICSLVPKSGSDLGVVVDPDVDRLVFVSENGDLFGEEYTLVAVADYLLSRKKGNCVSNLSSSRALNDIAIKHDSKYFASAVGEVNVVDKMKDCNAIIGGEGNGGIIYPPLHYGRDSLVGIALFLTHLAYLKKKDLNITTSDLRSSYPDYHMSKEKVTLSPSVDLENILNIIADKYSNENLSRIDGVKIDFEDSWVHLRKSNTEPIVRIYAEAKSKEEAEDLAKSFVDRLNDLD
ncbi:MAG: Phosphomannomutase/phosphoglucomutase [Owenweeksia sp. TMED14]|nr:MAG: Phosphomannomutase/phosphoglucomutase [Owenweeksia sp. TMED14]|tara:strand:+ start:3632 stop:5041 length:1410 start_codon:yes stop_codon:yes gene_type:complete